MRRMRSLAALLSCIAWFGVGCSPGEESAPARVETDAGEKTEIDAEHPIGGEMETLMLGDLADIRERGFLRVLSTPREVDHLPREASPFERERGLVAQCAESLGVDVVFVPIRSFEDLLPALLEGRGDIAIRNLTVTAARQAQVAFSTPLSLSRAQIVSRRSDPVSVPKRKAELAGRRLSVRRASAFWQLAQDLQKEVPELIIEVAPDDLDTESMLEQLELGDFDLIIVDSNVTRVALAWHPDLEVAFDLGKERVIAWAIRPDSRALLRAVNRYLARNRSRSGGRVLTHLEDLPGIEERKVLRILTRNSSTTYFLWRGELMGFEYELMRRFAEERGLRAEFIVPPTRDDLIPWLVAGRGDVVAAGLTASHDRYVADRVQLTRPYHSVREMLVSRDDEVAPSRLEDLAGRSIAVRRSSSYWLTLQGLLAQGARFELVEVPEDLETERIIGRVAQGEYDLTVADNHILDVELSWRDDVHAAFPLGESVDHAWAVRQQNTELASALDAFIKKEYRSLFYNMTLKKYFGNPLKMQRHAERRVRNKGEISQWDELTKTLASRHGFDWRLILAVMYQESRFDPNARSFAGAQGLMQVMPRTGRQMGYQNLLEPENGLRAGVEYLDWVRDRFEPSLEPDERLWFALAAYNAGAGHVRDARRLARKNGWDPDRWFGNVERAILLKQDPKVYKQTRFGYCRGSETANYVRQIRDRYAAYLEVGATDPAHEMHWAGIGGHRSIVTSFSEGPLHVPRMR